MVTAGHAVFVECWEQESCSSLYPVPRNPSLPSQCSVSSVESGFHQMTPTKSVFASAVPSHPFGHASVSPFRSNVALPDNVNDRVLPMNPRPDSSNSIPVQSSIVIDQPVFALDPSIIAPVKFMPASVPSTTTATEKQTRPVLASRALSSPIPEALRGTLSTSTSPPPPLSPFLPCSSCSPSFEILNDSRMSEHQSIFHEVAHPKDLVVGDGGMFTVLVRIFRLV